MIKKIKKSNFIYKEAAKEGELCSLQFSCKSIILFFYTFQHPL